MTETWGFLPLKEIESINTQSIWHAAALTRESFGYDNLLFIDWPDKPFVSVGYHQDPNVEVDIKYCEQQNYEVYRRSCGGGQVFLDGNQIFYHMITNPENSQLKGSMRHFYEKLLTPVINTYNELGVNAVYAPVNDIVAENKKVSGNGAATLGDSRILTGNFILSFPSKEMSKVLRVPDEKFRDKIAQSLDERVGSFQSLTGSIPETDVVIDAFTKHFQSDLGVELIQVEMTPELKGKLNQLNQLYKTSEWMYENSNKSQNLRAVKIMGGVFVCESMIKTNGGLIKGIFVLDNNKITDANLTGDISVDPIDGLSILERKLVGQEVGSEGLRSELTGLLSQLDMPGVTVDELMTLITQAAQSHKENQ